MVSKKPSAKKKALKKENSFYAINTDTFEVISGPGTVMQVTKDVESTAEECDWDLEDFRYVAIVQQTHTLLVRQAGYDVEPKAC